MMGFKEWLLVICAVVFVLALLLERAIPEPALKDRKLPSPHLGP
jgi:hypothetical protein